MRVIVRTTNRTCRRCYHAMCRLVWFCCVVAKYAFRICSASLLKAVRNHTRANPSFASLFFCWCGWPFLDTSQRQIKNLRGSQKMFSFARFKSSKIWICDMILFSKDTLCCYRQGPCWPIFSSWQIAAAFRASSFFQPEKHLLVWKQCSTSYRCLWCWLQIFFFCKLDILFSTVHGNPTTETLMEIS